MAEELGMTTSAYSKIERAEINIPLNRIYQIAEVLDVPVVTFFQEQDILQFRASPQEKYGYATIAEVEELRDTIKKMQSDIRRIKQQLDMNLAQIRNSSSKKSVRKGF